MRRAGAGTWTVQGWRKIERQSGDKSGFSTGYIAIVAIACNRRAACGLSTCLTRLLPPQNISRRRSACRSASEDAPTLPIPSRLDHLALYCRVLYLCASTLQWQILPGNASASTHTQLRPKTGHCHAPHTQNEPCLARIPSHEAESEVLVLALFDGCRCIYLFFRCQGFRPQLCIFLWSPASKKEHHASSIMMQPNLGMAFPSPARLHGAYHASAA